MAKKLVIKEDRTVKEQEPDIPESKPQFSRYSNINMRMKAARR